MNWREQDKVRILESNWRIRLAGENQVRAFIAAVSMVVPIAWILSFGLRRGVIIWGILLIIGGVLFGFTVRRSSHAVTERYGAVAASMTLVAGWASILWVGCNSGLQAFATLLSWSRPICTLPLAVVDPANTSLIAAFAIGAAAVAFFSGYRRFSPAMLLAPRIDFKR